MIVVILVAALLLVMGIVILLAGLYFGGFQFLMPLLGCPAFTWDGIYLGESEGKTGKWPPCSF